MKLPNLTQKIASIFRELTRTGTARGPGAVGQNSDSMGPPAALMNDAPLSPSGVPSPSTPCNDAAIQGYYACGHDGAKRITQQRDMMELDNAAAAVDAATTIVSF